MKHPFITEIEVEGLYNLYSYKLALNQERSADLSRLLILYGDNGSGKTSLLKLIFNLLSPALKKGHRTFLASTPFRRFAVKIGTRSEVIVKKVKGSLLGSYQVVIKRNGRTVLDGLIEATDENKVPANYSLLLPLTESLSELNLALFYLSDERTTLSSTSSLSEDVGIQLIDHENLLYTDEGIRPRRRRTKQERSEQALEIAVRRLESFFRTEALKGSNEGEANTNNIYTDVVRRIARAKGVKEKSPSENINKLQSDLVEMEERSRAFSEYALITPLQMDGLIEALSSASGETKQIMANVLAPYVNGIRARLDALQEVQNLLELMVESVNSFFHNKKIAFNLRDGFQINSENGDKLSPKMLSSGERQLLLLFCNTIMARDQASIFLIDEPEISLNIKWQRKLLDVLLACTEGSAVQFVIATHSLELLARHKSHVLRLTDDSREHHARTR